MPFPLLTLVCLTCVIATVTAVEAPSGPRTAESAVTPFDRNPDRHNQFMQRIKQGPIGLLFLGDSITDSWPGHGKDSWDRFAPYDVADFGVSGERTEDVLWRITHGELDGIDPKAVVMMIGTNNIGHFHDEKPEWVAAGIRKLVDTIRTKVPKAQVLLLGIFPRGASAKDELRQKVVAINALIQGYDDGDHVHYLDLSSRFLDADGNLPHDMFPDFLHPTDRGYQIWYDAIMPILAPWLK